MVKIPIKSYKKWINIVNLSVISVEIDEGSMHYYQTMSRKQNIWIFSDLQLWTVTPSSEQWGKRRDLVKADGKVEGEKYRVILGKKTTQKTRGCKPMETVFHLSARWWPWPVRITLEWLRSKHIHELGWPSQSPALRKCDTNPAMDVNRCPFWLNWSYSLKNYLHKSLVSR